MYSKSERVSNIKQMIINLGPIFIKFYGITRITLQYWSRFGPILACWIEIHPQPQHTTAPYSTHTPSSQALNRQRAAKLIFEAVGTEWRWRGPRNKSCHLQDGSRSLLANQVASSQLGPFLGWKMMEEYVTRSYATVITSQVQLVKKLLHPGHQVPSLGSTLVTWWYNWWHNIGAIGVPAGAYGSSQCIANVAHVQELRMHENEAWKGLRAIDGSWFVLAKWSLLWTAFQCIENHWHVLFHMFLNAMIETILKPIEPST